LVSDCLFLYTSSVDARTETTTKSINLVVCNENDDTERFIDLHNDEGSIAYPSDGEGVINSNLAYNLGLAVGDTISVYDSDMREMTVTITALCDNYVYNYLYINEGTYEENWGHLEKNSAFVLGVKNQDGVLADPHGDGAQIMNARNVAAVTITQDFRDRIDNMMKSLDYIVALVVICAAALAFIVLYNLTNINITERIREIATIKVLGFYANETAAYVFRENLILTAIASVVGLPLGTALHAFVMSQVKIDMLSFDVHIEPLSYLLGIFITFVFAFLVNLVMQRKLSKVSMTESLKSIE
jgi:putative ABC transport system permease protein